MFINNEPGITYFQLRETNVPEVKRVAAYDSMINNADRKGGHTIKDLNGRVWSIDHGLTFNVEHKLRTVIWDFAGDSIPPESIQDIQRALFPASIVGVASPGCCTTCWTRRRSRRCVNEWLI